MGTKKLKNLRKTVVKPELPHGPTGPTKPIWLLSNKQLVSISNASSIKTEGAKLVFAYSTAGIEVVMSSDTAAEQTFKFIAQLLYQQNIILAEVGKAPASTPEESKPSSIILAQ